MRTSTHATSNSSMGSSTGPKPSRIHGSPRDLQIPSGSSRACQAATMPRSDIEQRAAEQARRAGADAQARVGSPRWRRPARHAPLSSPLSHVALVASTCDTGVPTVRALVGKGMQLLRKNMRRSPADVLLHLRQSEKKFVCRERYTQLRKGGGQSLSSIVASS